MKQSILVSIIMPCYNAEAYIAEAIESVLSQTYKNWELIIVDDCSIDGSLEIVVTYVKEDKRMILIKSPKNLGAAMSRNKALVEAKGDFVTFLDSDDIWLPEKLERQLHLMEKTNALMSYTAYYSMDSTGVITKLHPVDETVSYDTLLKKPSMIGTLTMIYNVKKLGKIYFQTIGHEDYAVKLEILKKIKTARGINEPLAKYRIQKNSLSGNKLVAAKWVWNIYRKSEKLSIFKSLFYLLHYGYYSFTKYKNL